MTLMKLPEQIETNRLLLRPPRAADASSMFTGWAQDVEVTRYLTWRPHTSPEESQVIIAICVALWKDETRFPYIITLKESSEAIGMIDPRVEGHQVGVGYVLGRVHWGNGYMPEATLAIIEWAFQQPTIYRVYATTDVENSASQRVLEKVGMQREGLLRKYIVHPNISDIPRDSYIYAITK